MKYLLALALTACTTTYLPEDTDVTDTESDQLVDSVQDTWTPPIVETEDTVDSSSVDSSDTTDSQSPPGTGLQGTGLGGSGFNVGTGLPGGSGFGGTGLPLPPPANANPYQNLFVFP